MLHTAYLATTRPTPDAGTKTLLRKASGRFYTPDIIGLPLVVNAVKKVIRGRSQLSIVDPFCGDGRLLVWTLQALSELDYRGTVNVCGWDLDKSAMAQAKLALKNVIEGMSFNVKLSTRVIDTLLVRPKEKFDLVVTNPPWDVLKPDRRDLSELSSKQQLEYIKQLRAQSERLGAHYIHSQAVARYSGWNQNLARIGCELSMSLLSARGTCGIVLPATLLADQASGQWRDWLFREFTVDEVEYYSAERRLFIGVDQPCVAMTIHQGQPGSSSIHLKEQTKSGASITSKLSRADISSLDNRLPLVHGTVGLKIHKALNSLTTFRSLENELIWAGRELDETNFNSYLAKRGTFRFVKGKMVGRFQLSEQPIQYIAECGPVIPTSSNFWRLAWRDVSRPTQKRRMQATLLAPTMVTGNSLNVAYMRDGDITKLKWLLGVMNSLVFEFQVRSFSATAHISLGTARLVRVPPLDFAAIQEIAALASRRLHGDHEAELLLEVAVAQSYGLNRQAFSEIVHNFHRFNESERTELLARW